MSNKLMPIGLFVEKLQERLKAKDGYIMSSLGQNPKQWKTTSYYFSQYTKAPYTETQHKKALYWREHAERVWDCNGLSEGIYMDFSGVNINTKARYNFKEWCDVKGWGRVPDKYKKPGTAVFKASTKNNASSIHHVGYISRVVGDKIYVIEAKGVMYGVVETRYDEDKNWNAWGLMTKYFDYGDTDKTAPLPEVKEEVKNVVIHYGAKGDDVKELQEDLVALGYDLPKFGCDGDFGKETEGAIKDFQEAHDMAATGICDTATMAAIQNALKEVNESAVKTQYIKVTGSRVNVRTEPNTNAKILGVVKAGSIMLFANEVEGSWYKTFYKNEYAWISAKYSVLD